MEPISTRAAKLFVVSGAPGSGKTAVLDRLRDDIHVVDEPARAILAEQRASGGTGTWDQDVALFVRLLLERAIDDHERASALGGVALFDRGIPDCAVYAERAGVDARPSIDAADGFRYEKTVLFFEAWREIYSTDDERTLTFEGAESFGDALREMYVRCGYEILTVPHAPVIDRATFISEIIRREVDRSV